MEFSPDHNVIVPDPRSILPENIRVIFEDQQLIEAAALNRPTAEIKAATMAIAKLEDQQLQSYIGSLVEVITYDTPAWGQNERDAVLYLLAASENILKTTANLDRVAIVENYANAVAKLPADADYFGAPYSLYQAGLVLGRSLGTTTDAASAYGCKLKVTEAWSKYYEKSTDMFDKDDARDGLATLSQELFAYEQPLHDEENSWKWARKQPVMKEDTALLHNFFIDECRTRGSFKQLLLAATPRFNEQLVKLGIQLEKFWNLSDSDNAVHGLQQLAIRSDVAVVLSRFDKVLQVQHQLKLSELLADENLARAMSDEIHAVAGFVVTEMAATLVQPEQKLANLHQQVSDSVEARKPLKKLQPVLKLLMAVGIEPDPELPFAVWFTSDEVRAELLTKLHRSYEAAADTIKAIQQLFPRHEYPHLKFMERNESDLFAGDDTADCTAYHLECGFNGWTTVHWLANPAFELAYIQHQGRTVAKMGIMLAQDESGPRLVVDSIETSKSIADFLGARQAITDGIKELQLWADSLDLGEVFFCTYTNSTELAVGLPVAVPAEPPTELIAVGSVGLQEVWQLCSGQSDTPVSIGYLQSKDYREEDYDYEGNDIEFYNETNLNNLEKILAGFMTPELITAAQNGDADTALHILAVEAAPTIYETFRYDPDLFYGFDQEAEVEAEVVIEQVISYQRKELELGTQALSGMFGRKLKTELEAFSDRHDKSISSRHVAVKMVEHLEDTSKKLQFNLEAKRLESIASALRKLLKNGVTVERSLQRIFGQANNNTSNDIAYNEDALSKNLRVIDRSR